MLTRLVDILFGCLHSRTTFPMTTKGQKTKYVVCLDCGKKFAYDWDEMKRGDAIKDALPLPRYTKIKEWIDRRV